MKSELGLEMKLRMEEGTEEELFSLMIVSTETSSFGVSKVFSSFEKKRKPVTWFLPCVAFSKIVDGTICGENGNNIGTLNFSFNFSVPLKNKK